MTEVFVIANQSGHFWGKSKTWVDGSEAKAVLRVKNRDEATNTLFELSSKDFELRGTVQEVAVNEKGDPIVEVSDIPLPEVPGEESDDQESSPEEATATEASEAPEPANTEEKPVS